MEKKTELDVKYMNVSEPLPPASALRAGGILKPVPQFSPDVGIA